MNTAHTKNNLSWRRLLAATFAPWVCIAAMAQTGTPEDCEDAPLVVER